MKEKILPIFKKIQSIFFDVCKKLNIKWNPVIASLVSFGIIFLLALLGLRFWTGTGYVIACIMLVIETVLAVLLANTNYGILGAVGVAELFVAVFAKRIPVALLSLAVYFMALVVIHMMRKYKGAK